VKRNFNVRVWVTLLVVALLSVFVLSGCGSSQNDEGDVKLSIVGSTSVQPIAQLIADDYTEKNPNIKIDIQGIGSSAGIKAITDGTCDIGMASRELKESEKTANLTETVVAIDGIAIIVNPANAVQDLKKEDIFRIFTGEVKNWKEVGGEDKEIIVVSREAGSGTRGAFEELLKLEKKEGDKTISLLIDNALIAEGNGAVLANVAGKANAIGYMSLGMVDEMKVRKVKVDGVEATSENIQANKYAVARPFLMLTNSESSKETQAYLDYVLSDAGQKIVAKEYIPVK